MRFFHVTELKVEDEGKLRTPFSGLVCSPKWAGLKGQLLEVEMQSCEGKVHRAVLMEQMVCARIFFNCHLPSSKIICLTKILNLNGFDVREYGKDTLLIFYLTKEQTTKYCKKKSCLSSQTHMYTTQFKNTQEDPCRLNGWQPTETCIKNMENSRKHIFKFPTQLKEMKMKPSLKQKFFSPNKCSFIKCQASN